MNQEYEVLQAQMDNQARLAQLDLLVLKEKEGYLGNRERRGNKDLEVC